MSDEYGVNNHYRRDDTGWFVGVIVTLALLAIGYLMFSASEPADRAVTEKQAVCMIAHPGMNCAEVTRWEPIRTPSTPDNLGEKP